ncbi:hypothetical protein PHYSODRAFT_505473 [Phytophthora sojae]|uniref:Uncharacterized protein n=1 Tax=Phytophthora sojae (strain P6497) TaxID=1094619 RepID=G4ZQ76_PHYSP|nr:hypothetical protein PHYSODRAFT_505473 [Phytophthora sojae]EGZ14787.1 hypothetical protein PHYSODRAFT_505473 [Phytophthora sojae]|eukprot:XP_009528536.1 hypothetical protein PHYSODRAFT_505473 [Phytophthora sojae]
MIERRLHCKSPTSKERAGRNKCRVQWKVHTCKTASTWVILQNEKVHVRGEMACAVLPRPKVTPEMRNYIQRMDENAVPPPPR